MQRHIDNLTYAGLRETAGKRIVMEGLVLFAG